MTASLPSGFVARPPRRDDADAIVAIIAACQQVDLGVAEITLEEFLADWHAVDLETEAILVLSSDGRATGYADLVNRANVVVSVYGYVAPASRGAGVGRFLVDWGERWTTARVPLAPAAAQVVVQHYLPETNNAGARLLRDLGYAHVRTVYEMAIDLDERLPDPAWPAGITVTSFVPGRDDRPCHEAVEDAFRDVWGRPPGSFEDFAHEIAREGFEPGLWLLARAGDEIAGVVLGQAFSGSGWIDTVAVRRRWRRRGLGLALLRQSFAEYARRGTRHVRLSVDAASATGAPRLYLRAGMHVERSYALYRKVIRPGDELAVGVEQP